MTQCARGRQGDRESVRDGERVRGWWEGDHERENVSKRRESVRERVGDRKTASEKSKLGKQWGEAECEEEGEKPERARWRGRERKRGREGEGGEGEMESE